MAFLRGRHVFYPPRYLACPCERGLQYDSRARGVAAYASEAMQSDTRAATNLNLIERFRDQFSTDFESAPREGSVQLKINQGKISSDGKSTWLERERERKKVVDLEYGRF
ncbi:hypothetical protein Bca4012_077719 [Brassica carinata]